ncbi:MAG: hypothetical protein KDB27_01565 [Planctomycetales bacterium]|nr:hypothetical protein [Planctomycetales bacterium]
MSSALLQVKRSAKSNRPQPTDQAHGTAAVPAAITDRETIDSLPDLEEVCLTGTGIE